MTKKPNYQHINLPKLLGLCKELGMEVEKKDTYQYRVYAAMHIIDVWPPRMVHHIIEGETVKAIEPYYHELDHQFNKNQVKQLLLTGEYK